MKKATVQDSVTQNNNTTQFAKILRELLKTSPKQREKTTYKALAEYLIVKQQSVSSWANGTTIPDTRHIAPIADYFGVSADYLLGRVNVKSSNPTIQAVASITGLSEESINALSHSTNDDESDALKESRQRVLNLLLSTKEGCLALHCLSAYFFNFKDKEDSIFETKDERHLSAVLDFIDFANISGADLADIAFLRATKHLQDLRENEV